MGTGMEEPELSCAFPWIVNHDENRSSTIEMMAASARDALISAQELVKQDVLVQGKKFEKTCAVTDRLEEAKLSDLRAKFGGKHLEDAKKVSLNFAMPSEKGTGRDGHSIGSTPATKRRYCWASGKPFCGTWWNHMTWLLPRTLLNLMPSWKISLWSCNLL